MRTSIAQLPALLLGIVLLSGTAAAHEGHTTHDTTVVLALAVFVSGLCFLGAGLYLDQREDVEPKYSDLGVFLGVGGLVVSIALFVF